MLKGKSFEEKTNLTTLLSTQQLPIIDLAHMGTEEVPVKSVVNRVASQLHRAMSERGLAVLVNHGIPEEKLNTAWKYLDTFCELPTEIKDVYLRKRDGVNHGYVKPGQEKFDGKKKELRHAFNICMLSGASLPEDPLPGFRDHIADLTKDFKNLSSLLLQALAVALELPINYFLDKHAHMLSGTNENETTLRLLYYPPIVEDDNKCELVKGNVSYRYQKCASDQLNLENLTDKNDVDEDDNDKDDASGLEKHRGFTRCGAHCDYGTFTLLAQDSEGGLECKLPQTERWQRVGHLPGSILINTGELLSMWTDNKYPALPHRVVVPDDQYCSSKGRHSMAFFCHPDNSTVIAPIESKILQPIDSEEDLQKKKKKKNILITAYQVVQNKFKQTYSA
ncbi:uncharacterized protein LOC129807525 [Phlebotomus papatasi]|nr:uncharacterized protein LOC129807525 [Phlebotomus papatasi]